MTLPLRKRRRPPPAVADSSQGAVRFPEVGIFLVEKRMGSSRRAFLSKLARSKGFRVEAVYSDTVTHVVSEQNTRDEVCEWLQAQPGPGRLDTPALLDVSWFTESMASGSPVLIEPRHCLVDALEILAEEAEFGNSEGRSLAFARAASVLRSIPYAVTRFEDLNSLPCFGAHSRKIVQEITEDGSSVEVQRVLHSERYHTLKVFSGIFGVGKKTADRWYQEGLRTLDDLRKKEKKLNRQQEAGLQHYTDLNSPVTRLEADKIQHVVQDAVLRFLPGAIITLTGGFRRGKQSGHDVDFLITHPTEGKEMGLLIKVVSWLSSQGLLLYHHMKQNSYKEPTQMSVQASKDRLDHFESCFSIFKLDTPNEQMESSSTAAENIRNWKALRVDLVVTPFSQYPFALLGWTGSKHFERELRRFAVHERKMILNSHALYDTKQNVMLPAHSEEDIFAHLGLDYILPTERNA
ncbi:DNA-directed DNA/RNA polymerase mu isoform X2 [Pleurodeles waltl]|uniref:DNA-directed DNA/RNA polymerase mu isoform X2 n=1 Tax=Pleurodeles waltl TaxID=8319 RepID=UPI00370959CC